MKIVFMGTPEFAVASLDILVKNEFDIVSVITSPDKPAGRGRTLQQSAVKKYSIEKGIPLMQPHNLKDPVFLKALKDLKADLQIVVAFRMLPELVWNMPPLGTYNLHASLLPRYRGAAPINWAIINGEKETGVSTFKLRHEIDSGQIVMQEVQQIGDETTAGELHDLLMVKGAELLLKTVRLIETCEQLNQPVSFKGQDESLVSHAPKITKETCRINWNLDPKNIHNRVRGLSPHPAAFTHYISGQDPPIQFKVFRSSVESEGHTDSNGTLYTDNKSFLSVACKGGKVRILELQQEGKKRQGIETFLKGFKIKEGSKFV